MEKILIYLIFFLQLKPQINKTQQPQNTKLQQWKLPNTPQVKKLIFFLQLKNPPKIMS